MKRMVLQAPVGKGSHLKTISTSGYLFKWKHAAVGTCGEGSSRLKKTDHSLHEYRKRGHLGPRHNASPFT
eukprot:441401-Pelagomonas_calceolata.AAC.1